MTKSIKGKRLYRADRPRLSGSTPEDPLVVFQTYKIRQSTVEELRAGALEKGWSAAALVRKLLDEWAEKRRAGKSRKKEVA